MHALEVVGEEGEWSLHPVMLIHQLGLEEGLVLDALQFSGHGALHVLDFTLHETSGHLFLGTGEAGSPALEGWFPILAPVDSAPRTSLE